MTLTYSADAVVLQFAAGMWPASVLLIRRPLDSGVFPGAWALPGGMVAPQETGRQTAARMLDEKTGIPVRPMCLKPLGIYDVPGRDPRGRAVSAAFSVLLRARSRHRAGDGVIEVKWAPVTEVLAENALAFDHCAMIAAALRTEGFTHLLR